jgi:hypothetical protein
MGVKLEAPPALPYLELGDINTSASEPPSSIPYKKRGLLVEFMSLPAFFLNLYIRLGWGSSAFGGNTLLSLFGDRPEP